MILKIQHSNALSAAMVDLPQVDHLFVATGLQREMKSRDEHCSERKSCERWVVSDAALIWGVRSLKIILFVNDNKKC